jgi:hypothetical protein
VNNDAMTVLVFSPIGEAIPTGVGDTFSVSTAQLKKLEPVGMLCSQGDDTLEFLERLRAEVTPHGCEVDYVVRQTSDTPGYLGCLIAIQVRAPDMKTARDLPGFIPLYDYTGEMYDLTQCRVDAAVARSDRDVVEHEMAEGMHPPLFGDSDAVYLTMIPLGQIGGVVFLKDRPSHWYQIRNSVEDKESAIASVRELVGKAE